MSSTFRDMDAERDAVKFHVINRLNRRYRPCNISFQVVDLRIGINTQTMGEQEGENKVLEMCLSKIDQARPFFIGLLGNRYGWCPEDIRIETVLNRIGAFAEKDICLGRSVTEIEIIHSMYKGDSAFRDSLFFIRSSKSYEGMPPDVLEQMDDRYSPHDTTASVEKLESLKQRLWKDYVRLKSDNIYTYDLSWNHAENKFGGIEEFVELVYDAMCRRVEKDLSDLSAHTRWYEIEGDMVRTHFEVPAMFSVPLPFLESGNVSANMVLSGTPGSGKTTAISQIYNHLKGNTSYHLLAAAVGASEESIKLERIMIRWLFELSEDYGAESLDSARLELMSRHELKQKLGHYCRIVISMGKTPIFLLDSVERFTAYNPDDMLNDWLPKGCFFIGTVDSSKAEAVVASFSAMHLDIDGLTGKLTVGIIDNFERIHAIELPSSVAEDMERRSLSPRNISLIFKFLSNLSSTDYKYIRNLDGCASEIDKINGYILNLYLKSPDCEAQRLHYYLKAFVHTMNMDEGVLRAIGYVAASHCGLSREQIVSLLGYTPPMMDLELILNLASDYIIEHSPTHVILFSRLDFAETYLEAAGMDIRSMSSDIANLTAGIPDDELTDDLYLLKICTSIKGCNRKVVDTLLQNDIYSERGEMDGYDSLLWGKAAYLINESSAARLAIEELIDMLAPPQSVKLLYLMHRCFPTKDIGRLAPMIDKVMECGVEDLGLSSAYALGWTLCSMAQYGKYGFMEASSRERYLRGAERVFWEILSKTQSYHDASNMHMVALVELMEAYSIQGDDTGMMEIMEKLTNLNI